MTRPLLLTTRPEAFAARSGYPRLADHLPEVEVVSAPRRDPTGWRKAAAAVARRLAFSRWYLGGSAVMEWRGAGRVRAASPDLVHVLWGDLDLGFLDLFTRQCGVPLVATFHHCDDTLGEVIRFPRRLRQLAAVVLMSETQRPFMREAGVPDERIHVVHHGVDADHFRPAGVRPAGRFRVLSVGGYRRDFACLLSVCDRLSGWRGVDVEVIGPAATAGRFAGRANVRYRSGLSDDELLQAYQSADCLLMCVENATANNALLEGMACGLPVVGSLAGGLPEYVPADAGVLMPNDRPEALADAVLWLLNDPPARHRMAAAARRRAEQLHWPRVAARTRAVYAAVLDAHRRRDL